MKKLLLLFVIAPVLTLAQSGPFEEDGVFVFGSSVSVNASADGKTGYDLGLAGEYLLGGHFTLLNGVGYSKRNFSSTSEVSLKSLKVPLSLNYYTDWDTDCVQIFGITLNAGLQLNLFNEVEMETGAADTKQELNKTSFDGVFGVGYRTGHLSFYIQKTIGLNPDTFKDYGIENDYWSFGVTYFFKDLKKSSQSN